MKNLETPVKTGRVGRYVIVIINLIFYIVVYTLVLSIQDY